MIKQFGGESIMNSKLRYICIGGGYSPFRFIRFVQELFAGLRRFEWSRRVN